MTTERPILFSAPMVRAILAGTKTVTRRVVKLPPAPNHLGVWEPTTIGGPGLRDAAGKPVEERERTAIWHTRTGTIICCPHGTDGDRLWVRETWAPWSEHLETHGEARAIADAKAQMPWASIVFRAEANGGHVQVKRWRPSIFLPRWASRLTLQVADVRVERLHDITAADILAEGAVARAHEDKNLGKCPVSSFDGKMYPDLRSLWCAGWDAINGKRAAWKTNPWVWRIEFWRVR